MKLYIQNMVCRCCKLKVKSELNKMGLKFSKIELGLVYLSQPIAVFQRQYLKMRLHKSGLELIEDKDEILVERIVAVIIKMIYESEDIPDINFSVFLTNELNQDYHSLSALFSKIKGTTIEHFIIRHKVERIKELITYDDLNLTEISYKLNYSSVQHLSNQFKSVTGNTPTYFKNIENSKRVFIENI